MTSKTTEQAAEESLETLFNNNSAKLNMLTGRWVSVEFATKTALQYTENSIAGLKEKNAGLAYNAYCRLEENEQLQSTVTTMQATLSEYKQKVEALEGENAELITKLNDVTFEIETGVDIVDGVKAENERLKGLLGLNAC